MADDAALAQPGAYRFGPFTLVPANRLLLQDDEPIRLGGRALDILIVLVGRAGQVVPKDELFALVWPDLAIEEGNLRVHVAALRKALGDAGPGTRIIATVAGRGYAFVAPVERIAVPADDIAPAAIADDRHALPAPLGRIIGRDAIIAAIAAVLPRHRFVTVAGTGGLGKTAVALAVARAMAGGYRDGVRFVDLSGLATGTQVPTHLASLLRLPGADRGPVDQIVGHLVPRHLLLVLDNCEHVIDGAARLAEEILRWAPQVHVLATSREPLRAASEWVQRLDPLPGPPAGLGLTAAEALRFPAAQLLAERARAALAGFSIGDADAPALAEICARLDGLPLAIELAAARVPLFGLRGVADRLDDRFALLTRGRRTAEPRHQTLAAMLDWSYETLTEPERRVWRRLSVFNAPFTLDAAASVAAEGRVIDIVDDLVAKSLVGADLRGDEVRYRLLESPRLYALARLDEAGEGDVVRRRHALHVFARSAGSGNDWAEAPSFAWLLAHGGDIPDIRASLDWAFGADPALAIRLTACTAPIWFKLLLIAELQGYLDRAIALAAGREDVEDEVLMRLNIALGHAIFHARGPVPEVAAALLRALRLAEGLRDIGCELQLLWALYGNYATLGDYAAVSRCIDWFGRAVERSADPLAHPTHDRMLSLGLHLAGRHEEAAPHALRALAHPRAGRGARVFFYDHWIATSAHHARILWMSGKPDQALQVIHEATVDALAVDQPFALGYFLVFGACPVTVWAGDIAMARRSVGLLFDIAAGVAFNVWQTGGRIYEQALEVLAAGDAPVSNERRARIAALRPTDFHGDNLSTMSWRLLDARSLARALAGQCNWSTAEVLRAHGQALLAQGDRTGAGAMFGRALDVARDQGALGWELRAATSLAALGGREDHDRLAEVYGRFSEGFSTRDLVAARTVLDRAA